MAYFEVKDLAMENPDLCCNGAGIANGHHGLQAQRVKDSKGPWRRSYDWINAQILFYNVTFGLYMLDWWERLLFNLIVISLAWYMTYKSVYITCYFWLYLFKGVAKWVETWYQCTNGDVDTWDSSRT